MDERFVDFGLFRAGAVEQNAAEDALGIVEVRLKGDDLAKLGLRGVDLRRIDEDQRAFVDENGVLRTPGHDLVDARQRLVESAASLARMNSYGSSEGSWAPAERLNAESASSSNANFFISLMVITRQNGTPSTDGAFWNSCNMSHSL